MNWDIVEGNWNQFKADLRGKFAKLTDSDWENIAAKKDKFFGVMQERYGYKKEEVARDLDRALESWKPSDKNANRT